MRNVIFDFDGVLGDTKDLFIQYHIHREPELSYDEAIKAHHSHFLQPYHSNQNHPSPERLHTQSRWLSEFIDFATEHNLLPVPLFQDFITILSSFDIPNTAVVSSGTNQYLHPALKDSPLDLSHILGFEDHHSKEEKIMQVCHDWGISTKETVYLTDTLSDVIEVQNVVGTVVGCTWGTHDYETLSKLLPDNQILKEFEEIYRLFPN